MTRRSVLSFAIGACGESCCAIDVGKALFSKCGLWPLAWRQSRGRSTQLLTNLKNTQQCTQKIPNPHRVRQSQPSCFLGVLFGRATRNWQHDAFRYNKYPAHRLEGRLRCPLGQSRKRAKPKAECDRDSEERKKEEAAASRVAPQNVDRGPSASLYRTIFMVRVCVHLMVRVPRCCHRQPL